MDGFSAMDGNLLIPNFRISSFFPLGSHTKGVRYLQPSQWINSFFGDEFQLLFQGFLCAGTHLSRQAEEDQAKHPAKEAEYLAKVSQDER